MEEAVSPVFHNKVPACPVGRFAPIAKSVAFFPKHIVVAPVAEIVGMEPMVI